MLGRLLRLPLHYQILLALVAGAVFGLAVNPGEVTLPDQVVTFRLELKSGAESGNWRVLATDRSGRENFELVFASLEQLRARFPNLFARYKQLPTESQVRTSSTARVTQRRVHLVEDDRHISIQYARCVDGRPVVTQLTVSTAEELRRDYPGWWPFLQQHGGGFASHVTIASHYMGQLFLRLLKMITVPLIVTSLVTGVSSVGDARRFGQLFGKTLLYYVSTSLLAIVTGIAVVNLIRPGLGAELPGGSHVMSVANESSTAGLIAQLINSMIPPNPVQALADAHFLSIITFSILTGIFIVYTGGRSGEVLREFFQAAFEVMMNLTHFIIRLAPLGVFSFVVYATASQGLSVFESLGWYMLTVLAALVLHATVTLPLILKFVAKRSPADYVRAVGPALVTAFSTASSNGTLPLTLSCVEQQGGIPNRISSFVLPLGATVNMDGTALYEAVAVLFIAQAYLGAVPLHSQIVVAVTALLASVGAAGIPQAGLVMMAIVLQAVGLPLEAQGLIIAVDRVLDMFRTSVNVWSDTCGCAVLARFDPDLRNARSGTGVMLTET